MEHTYIMKLEVAENRAAEDLLPPTKPDGSKIGINYADQYIKVFNQTLPDGTKVGCKRRGLKITLTVGDKKGEGLMRRLQHGPDPKIILQEALKEAATAAGVRYSVQNGTISLEG
jgi:hypothetical protein